MSLKQEVLFRLLCLLAKIVAESDEIVNEINGIRNRIIVGRISDKLERKLSAL